MAKMGVCAIDYGSVLHSVLNDGDVIRRLGSLVEVLHIHDNDGVKDQHKIPGTGVIDWSDVFSALDEIGYSGCYNLEPMLNHFGENFEEAEAEFSAKVLEHMLKIKN
jgi:sugar phosphate isomerase/epimerase